MKAMEMKTIDLRQEASYKAVSEPKIINVPNMLFVMIDGTGAPENNPQFQQAMEVLFGIVYTIKFWYKKFSTPPGYAKFSLTPLEALWWMKNNGTFDTARPDDWMWTVMIRLPDFVTQSYFHEVVDELVEKKQKDIFRRARLEYFNEGVCVQLMHLGPYDQEQPNIEKMHSYAKAEGYQLTGKHHELYFSDPRRTKPEKLKTIIRQPIMKGSVL